MASSRNDISLNEDDEIRNAHSDPGSDRGDQRETFSKTQSQPTTCKPITRSTACQKENDPSLHNLKQTQIVQGKMVLWLSYQSMGVIFGDIGTSPLYVYSSTFSSSPSRQDIIGALSIIIWSLFMMVTVKYVFIILNVNNEGEGGTFSIYILLSRYMKITNHYLREKSFSRMKRHSTGDLARSGQHVRHGLESSTFARRLLKFMGVLAVALIISHGLLAPTQAVLGAVQGLEIVNSSMKKATVIGVTDAILLMLFFVQPLGTGRISFLFAPIIIIWLSFNAAFGIYNLVRYDAGVSKAFNPWHGFDFLIRNSEEGWRMLGGLLIAFTGVEALFAELGAFRKRAIQISWVCFTFPCLLLTYSGQAAFISVHPRAYSNPFFSSVPPGTIYPSMICAILAAVVTSQAVINATSQLLAQMMKLSYFPQVKLVHTSNNDHGQFYIPIVNTLLMIGTVAIASIYKDVRQLLLMLGTTTDIYYGRKAWEMHGTFLSSALTKVNNGGWFTLTIASALTFILLLWRFGKEQQWSAEAKECSAIEDFLKTSPGGQLSLTDQYHGIPLSTINGFGIFFDKTGDTPPFTFTQFIVNLEAIPEVTVFLHLRPLEAPAMDLERRNSVSQLAIPNCYRLEICSSYINELGTSDLASIVVEQIRKYLVNNHRHLAKSIPSIPPTDTSNKDRVEIPDAINNSSNEKKIVGEDTSVSEVAKLEKAFAHEVIYIMGKERLRISSSANWARRICLRVFLWTRDNTRTKMTDLRVPADNVVEVGVLKDV